MKLIMENWRRFLIEAEQPDHIHGTAGGRLKYSKAPGSKPLLDIHTAKRIISEKTKWNKDRIKKDVLFLIKRYNKNPKIKKAMERLNSSGWDDRETLNHIQSWWNFLQPNPGGGNLVGSVWSSFDNLELRWRPTDFDIYVNPKAQDIRYRLVKGNFFRFTARRHWEKRRPTADDWPVEFYDSDVVTNFIKFANIMISAAYASTYVHELYHLYVRSFQKDTDEMALAKAHGGKTTSALQIHKEEIQANSAEKEFLVSLRAGLQDDLFKEASTFPGNFDSWGKDTAQHSAEDYSDEITDPAHKVKGIINELIDNLSRNAKRYSDRHLAAMKDIKTAFKEKQPPST